MARYKAMIGGGLDDEEIDVDLSPPSIPAGTLPKRSLVVREAAPLPVGAPESPTGLPIDLIPELLTAAEAYFGDLVDGLTESQKLVVINYLRCCNPSRAAAGVGVSIIQHRAWLKSNTAYQIAWEAADEAITDLIEEVAIRKGLSAGDPKLLLGLLRGRRHKRYNPAIELRRKEDEEPQSWAELAKSVTLATAATAAAVKSAYSDEEDKEDEEEDD